MKVILRKDEAVGRYHPWIFSGAIQSIEGEVKDGDFVDVYNRKGEWLACGYYNDGSIAIRIISFQKTAPDATFWLQKLKAAYDYRKVVGIIGSELTNCYRLIHAEGDGLPGLIIDIYAKTAVIQCHSVGMHRNIQDIANGLIALYGNQLDAIYDKSAETLPAYYAQTTQNAYLLGSKSETKVLENGHTFLVDWETGQKTGFFLDQRENRKILGQYVKGKSVLNAFCYSGGFSVYALSAGASLVHSVDVSAKAIELTRQNVMVNGFTVDRHEAYAIDVMSFLKNNTTQYEVMVVDPPAFAKNLAKRHNAVQGYKRLNEAALKAVAPGGILFTFSCSQVIDRDLFYNTIVAAALDAGRQIRVVQHLSQPADHPVNLFHPEGSYLKGLVLFVS